MKKLWRPIGIVVAVLLLIAAWVFGFLWMLFYVLGFYAALYFLSLAFKTESIVNWVLGAGALLAWVIGAIIDLFILYQTLRYMFEENFILGVLFLIFIFPLLQFLLYGFFGALAAPLLWFQHDLERRYGVTRKNETAPAEYTVLDTSETDNTN